jgi:acetyl esterase/lipase
MTVRLSVALCSDMASLTKVHPNLVYVSNSVLTGHALDLYEPHGNHNEAKPFPLVVYIHGGGWTERDKQGSLH